MGDETAAFVGVGTRTAELFCAESPATAIVAAGTPAGACAVCWASARLARRWCQTATADTRITNAPAAAILLLARYMSFAAVKGAELLEPAVARAPLATVEASAEGAAIAAPAATTAASVAAVDLTPRCESRSCSFSRERSTRLRAAFSVRP